MQSIRDEIVALNSQLTEIWKKRLLQVTLGNCPENEKQT